MFTATTCKSTNKRHSHSIIPLFIALLLGLALNMGNNSAAQADTTATLVNFDASGKQITRYDTQGNAIDAHDGGISQFGSTYYLYGTSYHCGFVWEQGGSPFCGFKSYSSTDLVHWKDDGFLFDAATPQWQAECSGSTIGCFRPHVIYNASTRKYVLWFNDDTAGPSGYRAFEATQPTGPFTSATIPTLALNSHSPGGNFNGDENLFVDPTSGTAYIAYAFFGSSPAIVVEQLDANYETGTGSYVRVANCGCEAPAMFVRNGQYYVTYGPYCAYCGGQETVFSVASSPLGTYSSSVAINSNSCGGQNSHVAVISGSGGSIYLYQSDLWNNGAHNEALANYFWAPLGFNGDGSIQSFSCGATYQVTLSGGQSSSQQPLPGIDQADGVNGFISYCDIGGNTQRMQTFTPSFSQTLTSVMVTTFQEGPPNADLHVDVVSVNAQGQPTGTLSAHTIPTNWVGWSPHIVTVTTNIAVTAGQRYGLRISSTTTQGCFGFAYNDANIYPNGQEFYSSNNGGTFTVEANRALKFAMTLNLALGATPSASSSFEGAGWGLASVNDGQRASTPTSMGWSSNNSIGSNHTEFVQLDLGTVTPLGEADLYPRTDSGNVGQGFPIDFTIATSVDGTNWVTVVSQSGYPLPSNGAAQPFAFAAQNARYVRVQGTNLRPIPNDNGAYRMQFAEIELFAPMTDRALGATPTATSSHEGNGWSLSDVNDGQTYSTSTSMGWSSESDTGSNHTESVQLDLGSPITIGEFVLYPRSDGGNGGQGFPIDFTIATSVDGTNWTTVVSESGYPIANAPIIGGQPFFFPSHTARYVRVQGTTLRPIPAEGGAYRMQFAEIAIY